MYFWKKSSPHILLRERTGFGLQPPLTLYDPGKQRGPFNPPPHTIHIKRRRKSQQHDGICSLLGVLHFITFVYRKVFRTETQ